MPRSRRLGLTLLAASLLAALPPLARAQEAETPNLNPAMRIGNRCLDCHAGIETINAAMERRWHAATDCLPCHKGNGAGRTKDDAHEGLIAKPGDLSVVQQTCGACHSTNGQLTAALPMPWGNDHVDRVLRSPMALATGEIAVLRYLWGEQSVPRAMYGVRSVTSVHTDPAPGTVTAVAELPPAKSGPADHLLRTRCLQCHLWTNPENGKPPFRGAGCAACHVPYAEDGRSRSADPTISKTEPGHPAAHHIDRYPTDAQCLTCHRDEGLGIGWNFIGWVSPHADGTAVVPSDARALPVTPDVHAAASMGCIDCHDSVDVHGDGMVHSRGRTAVGVTCKSCHGTTESAPTFRTRRGDALTNVRVNEDGSAVLVTKAGGVELDIPVLHALSPDAQPAAHRIPGHGAPLAEGREVSCVACHSGDTAQHYVRHFAMDERQAVLRDGVAASDAAGLPSVIAGRWTITNTWSPVRAPLLGVRNDSEVYPLVPNVHAVRSLTDANGRESEHRRLLSTADGHYGIGFQTADPHRTTREGRACASCHADTAILGQGTASIDGIRLGWPLRYPPDQVADAEGTAIASFTTPDERPLNFMELQRTLRRPACIACHVDGAPAGPVPPSHSPEEADARHAAGIASRGSSDETASTPEPPTPIVQDLPPAPEPTPPPPPPSTEDEQKEEPQRKLSPRIGR